MTREDPTFKLRITPDLRKKVLAAARENKRSINAEIKSRLESSFLPAEEPAVVLREIIDRASALLRMFEDGNSDEENSASR